MSDTVQTKLYCHDNTSTHSLEFYCYDNTPTHSLSLEFFIQQNSDIKQTDNFPLKRKLELAKKNNEKRFYTYNLINSLGW